VKTLDPAHRCLAAPVQQRLAAATRSAPAVDVLHRRRRIDYDPSGLSDRLVRLVERFVQTPRP